MKITQPLISIIVPIYNVEKCMNHCLDSLLRQTYHNLEILLIDDGSKDHSLEICNDYAAHDTRFKVFHQENSGVGEARNLGLEHVQGEYIVFVDSDDYVDERFIEVLYDAVSSGDYDFSMVYLESTYSYNDQSQVNEEIHRTELTQKMLMNGLYHQSPNGLPYSDDLCFMVAWNKLYKRSLLQGLSFSVVALSEDLDFNNRVFQRAKKAVFADAALYHYYQRADSIVHQPNAKKYICRLTVIYKCWNDIPENQSEYRAACLTKLYKTLFSTRYLLNNIKGKTDDGHYDRTIRDVKKHTFKEMIHSPYISSKTKLIYTVFYHIPLTYRLFISWCDMKAKSK